MSQEHAVALRAAEIKLSEEQRLLNRQDSLFITDLLTDEDNQRDDDDPVAELTTTALESTRVTSSNIELLTRQAPRVVTPAAHSVGAEESECESGAEKESERDGEEEDDDSDDDLQIVASSAGTEAPAKKAKMTLTEEQERFAKQFLPAAYAFTLEPYVNGTPAPSHVTKEVDMAVAAPFLLANPDFSKTEVVKAYAHTIVAPAMDYWKQTIEGKKGDQLERMKAVRIFNPLHVLGNKISVSDIDGLKIFKFYEPPEIRAEIEVMKNEVIKYQALATSIKSFEESKDSKGKDTFDLSDWWKSNCATYYPLILRVHMF
jgi:hypothetical protein